MCDVVDGSVINGLGQPMLFSFVLDKPPGNKVFCELEILHYKKTNLLWILQLFIWKMTIRKKLISMDNRWHSL